jgi:hypothetical protein
MAKVEQQTELQQSPQATASPSEMSDDVLELINADDVIGAMVRQLRADAADVLKPALKIVGEVTIGPKTWYVGKKTKATQLMSNEQIIFQIQDATRRRVASDQPTVKTLDLLSRQPWKAATLEVYVGPEIGMYKHEDVIDVLTKKAKTEVKVADSRFAKPKA